MFRTVFQAFTSPLAGPVGFALSAIMFGLLFATVVAARHNEDLLGARISALTAENQRDGMALHARLTACESAPADVAHNRLTNASMTPEQRAQQLTGNEPQGFDVCARMESADRAVLETLR